MPLKQFIMRISGVNALLAHYYEHIGDTYQSKQNYEMARAAYIEAVYYGAGGRCKFKLGSCYQNLGEFKSARTWFYNVEDSYYRVEANEQMGVCATRLIDQATALIKEAEQVQDMDVNSAFAKLAAADNLLLNLQLAESTKERSLFLRHKLEWEHEQITFASKLEDAKAIVDIEDRLTALQRINNYFLVYRPYFNSTQLEQFEQSAKALQAAETEIQQQKNNKKMQDILLKVEAGITYMSEGNYDFAAHQIEQATWCYRDLVNAENSRTYIPVEELNRARADLLALEREANTLKYELPTIISENVAANLSRESMVENIIRLHLKEIKRKLKCKLSDAWDRLKPISPEAQKELETELGKILNENLAQACNIAKDGKCLFFRSAMASIDWSLIDAKIDQYLVSFAQTHKQPVNLELLKYLHEREFLEDRNSKRVKLSLS